MFSTKVDVGLAFRQAAAKGDLTTVKTLFPQVDGIDVAGPKSKQTALHRAAYNGHNDIVKYLLDNRANPNLKTAEGKTAINLYAEKNFYELSRSSNLKILRGKAPLAPLTYPAEIPTYLLN